MFLFKLVFGHIVEDPDGLYGLLVDNNYLKTAETVRVIATSDLETAREIGKAMKGERIYAYEYIGNLKKVELVHESPSVLSFTPLDQIWDNVLRNLKLNENDVDFHYQDGQKLGFSLK